MLKVSELIRQLQALDQDAPVVTFNPEDASLSDTSGAFEYDVFKTAFVTDNENEYQFVSWPYVGSGKPNQRKFDPAKDKAVRAVVI